MTKYQLHVLSDKNYWDLDEIEQDELWINIIAEGLGTSSGAAYLVQHVRSFPFGEDQVREASNLLSRISDSYFGRGPRGPRPILVTLTNVAKLCGVYARSKMSRWHHNFPHYSQLLMDLGLSASNVSRWRSDVEFSDFDIYRGIYVPTSIDFPTAGSLGMIYADGYITYSQHTPQLRLGGGRKDRRLYTMEATKKLEEAFNVLYEFPEEIYVNYKDGQYVLPRITIASKSIATYLINWIGFPRNEEERSGFRVSERIKLLDRELLKEFLSYYVSLKTVFSPNYGHTKYGGLRFTETSREFLEDLIELFSRFGIRPSMSVQQKTPNSYVLNVSDIPTFQMLTTGFFDKNQRLKASVRKSIESH